MIKKQYKSIFREKCLDFFIENRSFSHTLHPNHNFLPFHLLALHTSSLLQINSPSFSLQKRANLQERKNRIKQDAMK